MTRVLVLDIDGVLIETRGYLKALQDTVSHFSGAMGVGDLPPSSTDVRTFEAHGISSEWHMGAACVALLLVERVLAHPEPGLPDDWGLALAYLRERPLALPKPDYSRLAGDAGGLIVGPVSPSDAVLAALQARLTAHEWAVGALPGLMQFLLSDVHSFYHAPVTRVFQELAVGSQRMEEIYGVQPALQSASYLELYDRPLLNSQARIRLLALSQQEWHPVLCTLRPSLAPQTAAASGQGWSPEAETAREALGLDEFPVIGQGHINWLAQQVGEPPERLIKPFPVQALAAMGTALTGDEADALGAAYRLARCGELSGPLADQGRCWELHVVEDTRNGLMAFERAAEVLTKAGVRVHLHKWGVAGRSAAKSKALHAAGATVCRDVNRAIHLVPGGNSSHTL